MDSQSPGDWPEALQLRPPFKQERYRAAGRPSYNLRLSRRSRMPRRIATSRPLFLIALLATAACAARSPGFVASDGATIRSPAGHWDGVLRLPGSIPTRLAITLDSTDGAWHG